MRPLETLVGQTYGHLVKDILAEDWLSPGNDVSLRTIIEAINAVANLGIRTINTISPDAIKDFTLQAGMGITLSPILNGVEIAGSAVGGGVNVLQQSAIVPPGGSLSLALTNSEFVGQVWLESSGQYFEAGNTPDYAGKNLLNGISASINGRIGMAQGFDLGGILPVVHVVWDDGATVEIARFDGLTLALQERVSIGAGPLSAPPLVMVTSDYKVVVAWIDGTNQMFYGVLNPDSYVDATIPAYLNPPVATPAGPHTPNHTGKIVGAVSIAPAEAYIGLLFGGATAVGQFDTATPGGGTGFINFFSVGGVVNGSILDIVMDPTGPTFPGYVLEFDSDRTLPGNLHIWWFDTPYTVTGVAPFIIDTSGLVPLQDYYVDGCGMTEGSIPNPGNRSYAAAVVIEDLTATPVRAEMAHIYVDQVDPVLWTFPPPVAATKVIMSRSE